MTKVIILGAGVGGLTLAHELSKHPDYSIEVFELNEDVGGQARSTTLSDGTHTEYCWHAIANGYNNLAEILNEIPTGDDTTSLDHLKPVNHYYFITENADVHDYDQSFLLQFTKFHRVLKQLTGKTHYKDMLRGMKLWFYANSICQERLEELDRVSWKKFMSKFSPEFQRWAVDSTSIYMGMEQDDISTHLMFDLLRHNQQSPLLKKQKADFFSFDGPIQEVWFHPWVRLLESRGVVFHFNHQVKQLEFEGDLITLAHIKNLRNNITREYKADLFVNALSVSGLSQVYPILYEFKSLEIHSHQTQTQVLYHLHYRLPEQENTVYILHQSPWFLMTRHEGSLWELVDQDYLSCGIGMWNVPGLNGKMAIECTPKELAEECWKQMRQHAPYLFQEDLPEWNVWSSFCYNPLRKKLMTHEPKFSNNVGTLRTRPFTHDKHYSNLYHATAYTRTATNIFNMESAAEAGRLALKAITGEDRVKPAYKPGWFFRTMQRLHRFFRRS